MNYLPWWLGAPALAIPTVGYFVLVGRTMGVSGSVGRLIDWRRTSAADQAVRDMNADPAAARQALLAATREEFGDAAVAELEKELGPVQPGVAAPIVVPWMPWTAHALFIAGIFAGAIVTAAATGKFAVRNNLGDAFSHLVASGWLAWPVLLLGGVLVGFGTRMAGGCTTGHGISGCARMQPGSLIATGIFLGLAVAVSFVLRMVAS